MAPARSPLQEEWRRRDLLRLRIQAAERELAESEQRIAELEAQALGVATPEESSDVTPAEDVPRRVRELKDRIAMPQESQGTGEAR